MSKHFMNVTSNVRNRIAVECIRENANTPLSKWIACDHSAHTRCTFHSKAHLTHGTAWKMVDKTLVVFLCEEERLKRALKQLID